MAVETDLKSVGGLLESLHFNSAVLVEAVESEKCFNQAIERCFEFLEEADRGKLQSLISRGDSVGAHRCIQEAQKFFPDFVGMEQSDYG